MIVACVKAKTIKEAIADVESVGEKADLIEIRADFLQDFNGFDSLREFSDKLIITIRAAKEGGAFTGSERERFEAFRRFIKIKPRYIDVELNSDIRDDVIRLARRHGVKVIVSHHDFEKTPPFEELVKIRDAIAGSGADIAKIVTYARRMEDNIIALRLVAEPKNIPTVAFCMGDLGRISRILAPLFGAPFTYASVSRGKETASGQLTVDEVRSVWRVLQ